MVAECRCCECPLDQQQVNAAGMDNICYACWEIEWNESQKTKE